MNTNWFKSYGTGPVFTVGRLGRFLIKHGLARYVDWNVIQCFRLNPQFLQ